MSKQDNMAEAPLFPGGPDADSSSLEEVGREFRGEPAGPTMSESRMTPETTIGNERGTDRENAGEGRVMLDEEATSTTGHLHLFGIAFPQRGQNTRTFQGQVQATGIASGNSNVLKTNPIEPSPPPTSHDAGKGQELDTLNETPRVKVERTLLPQEVPVTQQSTRVQKQLSLDVANSGVHSTPKATYDSSDASVPRKPEVPGTSGFEVPLNPEENPPDKRTKVVAVPHVLQREPNKENEVNLGNDRAVRANHELQDQGFETLAWTVNQLESRHSSTAIDEASFHQSDAPVVQKPEVTETLQLEVPSKQEENYLDKTNEEGSDQPDFNAEEHENPQNDIVDSLEAENPAFVGTERYDVNHGDTSPKAVTANYTMVSQADLFVDLDHFRSPQSYLNTLQRSEFIRRESPIIVEQGSSDGEFTTVDVLSVSQADLFVDLDHFRSPQSYLNTLQRSEFIRRESPIIVEQGSSDGEFTTVDVLSETEDQPGSSIPGQIYPRSQETEALPSGVLDSSTTGPEDQGKSIETPDQISSQKFFDTQTFVSDDRNDDPTEGPTQVDMQILPVADHQYMNDILGTSIPPTIEEIPNRRIISFAPDGERTKLIPVPVSSEKELEKRNTNPTAGCNADHLPIQAKEFPEQLNGSGNNNAANLHNNFRLHQLFQILHQMQPPVGDQMPVPQMPLPQVFPNQLHVQDHQEGNEEQGPGNINGENLAGVGVQNNNHIVFEVNPGMIEEVCIRCEEAVGNYHDCPGIQNEVHAFVDNAEDGHAFNDTP